MTRTSIGMVTALCAGLSAGCGAQAGEEYFGEPLLQMRGHVTTTGLTLAPAITPALCFPERKTETLNFATLPEEIRAAFEDQTSATGQPRARIMDVEVEGVFPAEFKVNVYSPPPAAALEPLIPGEPPSVRGTVCAVRAEHEDVVEEVGGAGAFECPPSGPCNFTNVASTVSGDRWYALQQTCPAEAVSTDECTVTRSGDVTLLSETGGYEQVAAQVGNPELVYLAGPAAPGSYTAYTLGAPAGLPAGYHLLRTADSLPEDQAQAWLEQVHAVRAMALAETNAQHGTSYDELPYYFDGAAYRAAPEDVATTFKRTHARLEMELIPMQERAVVSPTEPGLTLELREHAHWFDRFPPPPIERREL